MPRRKPGQPPKKTGRPGKVTPALEDQVVAILKGGLTRKRAAAVIGVHYKTLFRHWQTHPEFKRRILKAEAEGEQFHLNKIIKSEDWKAAAWFLERKHWQRWGRRERQDVNVTGKMQHTHEPSDDVKRLLADRESLDLANTLARRLALHAGGAGQSAN